MDNKNPDQTPISKTEPRVTARAFLLGAFSCCLFAVLTVYMTNCKNLILTASQIPVLPYALLVLIVLLINPICRVIRLIRPFTKAELLLVFIMGMVSGGVSTFGLNAQLIPIAGSLFNRHWNNPQTAWDRHVVPYINEGFFVSQRGIRAAAQQYWAAVEQLETAKATLAEQSELYAGGPAPAPDPAAVGLVQNAENELRDREQKLRALEQKAFKKVDLFRRGLPDDLRAFPGFIPGRDENLAAYRDRLLRLHHGTKAAGHVRDALLLLETTGSAEPERQQAVAQLLEQAIVLLRDIPRTEELRNERSRVDTRWQQVTDDLVEVQAETKKLRARQRESDEDQRQILGKQVADLNAQKDALVERRTGISGQLETLRLRIRAHERVADTVAQLETIKNEIEQHDANKTTASLTAVLAGFPGFDASVRTFLVGDVPWSHWVRPLAAWGLLIVLTYTVLMAFNVLIFRQWYYNEKLVYPLGELPELLVGGVNQKQEQNVVPELFRSGLFWVGFSVSGGVLGWNLLCYAGLLPTGMHVDLFNFWGNYIVGTPLQGLLPTAKSCIFFTMIGLAFLIPKNISFSLWFFTIIYMAQLLVMVHLGYGVTENSFPSNWWHTLNFRTAEGTGALLVFSTVVLYTCRRYLVCAIKPRLVESLSLNERRELRLASATFWVGSAALIATLHFGMGAPLPHTLFTYAILLVITIGLIRAVTEGGILAFKAYTGPLHIVRAFFGMDKAWTSPTCFAPLLTYITVFFADIKAFIAPAMANSIKIREDMKMERHRFHGAVFAAIALTVVTAAVTALMLAYDTGADGMHGWFYSSLPRNLFGQIASLNKVPPEVSPGHRNWIIVGGGAMALLLYLRRTIFWMPHPIGMIMLINPIMATYWFSIFIGWGAKSLVTRYGNRNVYVYIRRFFVGLIVGELALICLAIIVALATGTPIPIDLNRN